MNFKKYYRLTKATTLNCFKICGIIFTAICVVIAIISGYKNKSVVDSFEIFGLCFLLGNGFGLFIWFLAITSAYSQVRMVTKFYESIPNKTRERFNLKLVEKHQDPRYNFLNLEVINYDTEHVVQFNTDNKFVFVSIINDLSTIDHFQNRMLEIQRKYKKEHIILTGWGLRKEIRNSKWKTLTCENIDELIERLLEISKIENIPIINRKVNNNDVYHN